MKMIGTSLNTEENGVVYECRVDGPVGRIYTTHPGESLAGIAMRELGDEARWTEIRDLNAERWPDMEPHDYYPPNTRIRLV